MKIRKNSRLILAFPYFPAATPDRGINSLHVELSYPAAGEPKC
jgi:hypothetical protein